jgi:hypothetical protein
LAVAEQRLTRLQEIILDLERLQLPLRDAVRLATQRVGFFVGQQRYVEERGKALKIAAGEPVEEAGGTGL